MAAPLVKPAPQAAAIGPGSSWFLVMVPSPVLGPDGAMQMAMHGPFLEMAQAAAFSSQHPGSLLAVQLILHQAAHAPAAPLAN